MALMYRPSNKLNDNRKKKRALFFILIFVAIALIVFLARGYYNNTMTHKENENENQKINLLPSEPKPVEKKDPSELIENIKSYLSQQTGSYALSVIELDDGRSFGIRDNEYFRAASTAKVGIAAYAYHLIDEGKLSGDKVYTYTSADYEGGTGTLQADSIGSKYKVSYLLERMIVVSDNVATNILIRNLGRSNIQSFLDNNGLQEFKVDNNTTTPRAATKLLSQIYNNQLISKKYRDELLGYMKKSITPTRLVAGVPKSVEVAHKIGSWSGAISDIGIVFLGQRPYAIAVYSSGVAWGAETDAVIAQISKMVYDFEKSF